MTKNIQITVNQTSVTINGREFHQRPSLDDFSSALGSTEHKVVETFIVQRKPDGRAIAFKSIGIAANITSDDRVLRFTVYFRPKRKFVDTAFTGSFSVAGVRIGKGSLEDALLSQAHFNFDMQLAIGPISMMYATLDELITEVIVEFTKPEKM